MNALTTSVSCKASAAPFTSYEELRRHASEVLVPLFEKFREVYARDPHSSVEQAFRTTRDETNSELKNEQTFKRIGRFAGLFEVTANDRQSYDYKPTADLAAHATVLTELIIKSLLINHIVHTNIPTFRAIVACYGSENPSPETTFPHGHVSRFIEKAERYARVGLLDEHTLKPTQRAFDVLQYLEEKNDFAIAPLRKVLVSAPPSIEPAIPLERCTFFGEPSSGTSIHPFSDAARFAVSQAILDLFDSEGSLLEPIDEEDDLYPVP